MTFVKQTGHLSRIAALAAIVNLGLNLALVPAFGMLASAWATAAAYLLLTAGYAIVGQRLWRIDYDIRSTITAVVLAAVLIPTARVLPDVSSGLTLGTKIAYVLLYGALLLATGVVRRSDFARLRVLGESRT
jgi:O-antigen/teichoic acid export membrane protein